MAHGGMHNMTMGGDDFCSGSGMVMMNGYQTSVGGMCILYLFKGASVDTATKYAFAIIGTFLLAFTVEGLTMLRKLIDARFLKDSHAIQSFVLAILYGVQMVAAYWLMLLVMTYEAGLFTAIIVGLVAGNFFFRLLGARLHKKFNVEVIGHPQGYGSISASTPCCAGSAI